MKANRTVVLEAAAGDDLAAVKRYIASGVDVNARSEIGSTALSWAARVGNVEMCEMLIAAGAQVNVADKYSMTPLHFAAFQGHPDVCGLLLRAGADPLALAGSNTPLKEAVSANCVSVCRIFEKLIPGLSARAAREGHHTAFQTAVDLGRVDLVRYFVLECGADLNQVTEQGRSLLDLADDDPEMQDCLRSLAAEVSIGGALDRAAESAPAAAAGRSRLAVSM